MGVGDDVQALGVGFGDLVTGKCTKPRERFRRAGPGTKRHLVGADMNRPHREEFDQLVEDDFQHAIGLFARRVQAVVREALD